MDIDYYHRPIDISGDNAKIGAGVVVGITIVIGAAFSTMVDRQAQAAPWPVFFVGSLCLAAITATAHGYVLQRLVTTRVAPVLLPDGRLDHLG